MFSSASGASWHVFRSRQTFVSFDLPHIVWHPIYYLLCFIIAICLIFSLVVPISAVYSIDFFFHAWTTQFMIHWSCSIYANLHRVRFLPVFPVSNVSVVQFVTCSIFIVFFHFYSLLPVLHFRFFCVFVALFTIHSLLILSTFSTYSHGAVLGSYNWCYSQTWTPQVNWAYSTTCQSSMWIR